MLFSTLSNCVAHCLCCLYTPTIHCTSPPPYFGPSVLNRNSTRLTLRTLSPYPDKSTSAPLFSKTPPNPPNIVNPIKHHPHYPPPPKQHSCTLSRCIGTMTSSTSHFLSRSSVHTHSLPHPQPPERGGGLLVSGVRQDSQVCQITIRVKF